MTDWQADKVRKLLDLNDIFDKKKAEGSLSEDDVEHCRRHLAHALSEIKSENLAEIDSKIAALNNPIDLDAADPGNQEKIRRLGALKERLTSMDDITYKDLLLKKYGTTPQSSAAGGGKLPHWVAFALAFVLFGSLAYGFFSASTAGAVSKLTTSVILLASTYVGIYAASVLLLREQASRGAAAAYTAKTGALVFASNLVITEAFTMYFRSSVGGAQSFEELGSSFLQILLAGSAALIIQSFVNLLIYVYAIKTTYKAGLGRFVAVLIVFWIVSLIVGMVLGAVFAFAIPPEKPNTDLFGGDPGFGDDAANGLGKGMEAAVNGAVGERIMIQNDRYHYSISDDRKSYSFKNIALTSASECYEIPKEVQAMCIRSVAEKTKNPSLCLDLEGSDRDQCYRDVAKEMKDSSLCGRIKTDYWKKRCIEESE
ncbi:MAG: hypothetical protein V1875_05885 [Candidatus Altiarchaeota archaeon]